jgi:hypothetical protein
LSWTARMMILITSLSDEQTQVLKETVLIVQYFIFIFEYLRRCLKRDHG